MEKESNETESGLFYCEVELKPIPPNILSRIQKKFLKYSIIDGNNLSYSTSFADEDYYDLYKYFKSHGLSAVLTEEQKSKITKIEKIPLKQIEWKKQFLSKKGEWWIEKNGTIYWGIDSGLNSALYSAISRKSIEEVLNLNLFEGQILVQSTVTKIKKFTEDLLSIDELKIEKKRRKNKEGSSNDLMTKKGDYWIEFGGKVIISIPSSDTALYLFQNRNKLSKIIPNIWRNKTILVVKRKVFEKLKENVNRSEIYFVGKDLDGNLIENGNPKSGVGLIKIQEIIEKRDIKLTPSQIEKLIGISSELQDLFELSEFQENWSTGKIKSHNPALYKQSKTWAKKLKTDFTDFLSIFAGIEDSNSKYLTSEMKAEKDSKEKMQRITSDLIEWLKIKQVGEWYINDIPNTSVRSKIQILSKNIADKSLFLERFLIKYAEELSENENKKNQLKSEIKALLSLNPVKSLSKEIPKNKEMLKERTIKEIISVSGSSWSINTLSKASQTILKRYLKTSNQEFKKIAGAKNSINEKILFEDWLNDSFEILKTYKPYGYSNYMIKKKFSEYTMNLKVKKPSDIEKVDRSLYKAICRNISRKGKSLWLYLILNSLPEVFVNKKRYKFTLENEIIYRGEGSAKKQGHNDPELFINKFKKSSAQTPEEIMIANESLDLLRNGLSVVRNNPQYADFVARYEEEGEITPELVSILKEVLKI